ncbi:hypothetical protein H6F44_10090 [Pseudanabaena sp. FACHB-1277]|uniref:Nucleotide exchange factor GrpE n=1 Tax=Pseudanabaena cinerea FACHB-1277 TaxID=2949581 RepID=A0A926UTG6_9CYAN|nr:nucleotide exchange factor GrpE [Pseudanabaena cinerea]MBD2150466.1 hypothetical protein [Pseudanabaena cinerea FACHB-1277]
MSTEVTTPNIDLQQELNDEAKKEESLTPDAVQTENAAVDVSSPESPETGQDITPEEVTRSSSNDVELATSANSQVSAGESSNNADIQPKSTYSLSTDDLVRAINEDRDNINKLFKSYKQLLDRYNKQNDDLNQTNESLNKLEGITRSQIEDLTSELNLVKGRLSKLEEITRFQFEDLVISALEQDAESFKEDLNDFEQYQEKVNYWHSKNQDLSSEMSLAISCCCDRITQCGTMMKEFESSLSRSYQDDLKSRYSGLETVKRMLERLTESLNSLTTCQLPSSELIQVQQLELLNLVRSQTDAKQAKQMLDRRIREIGDARYQPVREWRNLAEKLQKQWVNFIDKKILPALDGIDDGELHAKNLVSDVSSSHPNQAPKLSEWLRTYADLREILLSALKKLGVKPMNVEKGQPVDFLRHEPFTTETDPQLPNESVKALVRKGYEYQYQLEKQPEKETVLLRTALVVAVKNK